MTIASAVVEDIIAHAREWHPLECCGILLGHPDQITTAIRGRNIAEQPSVRFLIDPRDHIAARRIARDQRLDIVGFYHSHPHSPADPSMTDLAEAAYPECVHLIVGLVDGKPEVRVFDYADEHAIELPLEILNS